MRTDAIFYQLFQTFPGILFELVGEAASEADNYDFISKEIKELSFRFDGIYLPHQNTVNKLIYFVEVQFQKINSFYWDFFGEISLYLKQYQPEENWRAVAIFATRNTDTGVLAQYEEYFHSGRLIRIYLDELEDISNESIGLGVLKLVVAPDSQAGLKARELASQTRVSLEDRGIQEKVLELIDKILVYKFPLLSRQELEAMFGLDDLKQTRYFQDVREEGREEGRFSLVIRLLNRRVGIITPQIEEQVLGLTANKIEDLGEALLDFTSISDLEAWLQNNL
jgi:predicted transposase/invertase (TIGR01784 family)